MCGAKSTHKVGEEIMHDEPCMECGETFHPLEEDAEQAALGVLKKERTCQSFFHVTGPYGQRHNLTAYVCCGCFTKILGSATGCSIEP